MIKMTSGPCDLARLKYFLHPSLVMRVDCPHCGEEVEVDGEFDNPEPEQVIDVECDWCDELFMMRVAVALTATMAYEVVGD